LSIAPPRPASNDGSSDASTRTAWWLAACGLAGTLAVIGLLAPKAALAATMIGLLGLVAVYTAYMAVRLLLRLRAAPRSEFAPAVYVRPPQVLPHHIARIAPTPGDRNPLLAPGARAGVITVATERLWAKHGLNLHDPTHHADIERVLPPTLWEAVRPDRVDRRGMLVPRTRLLHSDLDRLLDDLESI
jgi:hypothetical protein